MVFAYYKRLTRDQRDIYRISDKVHAIRLPNVQQMRPRVIDLAIALKHQDKERIQSVCQILSVAITTSLKIPLVKIRVLAIRPSSEWEELHGFYMPAMGKKCAQISVWMRTARRRQVVAFRTFLRTLLHELCHHCDYELLKLSETFHAEGFYKRESSLFHQLVSGSMKLTK